MTNNNTAAAIEIRPSFESNLVETLTYLKSKIDPHHKSDVLDFVNRRVAHFIKMGYSLSEISAEVSLRSVKNYLGGVDGYLNVKVSTHHSFFADYFHFVFSLSNGYTKSQNEMVEYVIEQVKQYQEEKDRENEVEEADLPCAIEEEDEE